MNDEISIDNEDLKLLSRNTRNVCPNHGPKFSSHLSEVRFSHAVVSPPVQDVRVAVDHPEEVDAQ